ncbi:beta-ketoacyl-ACP synthase III [Streptomyces wuyuanensis]|uniref:beta-ketoacyl-ACP synthase III n=1 Tax=Streptomyces wuyuanensis TaxID=1196353 RepID=UPI0036B669F0
MTVHLNATPITPGTRILGVGHYRPANTVTNLDLIDRGVDTSDEWIRTRVGITERHWADPDETVIDMAERASGKALADSGVEARDIDLVLVVTSTLPSPVPAAAPELAHRLGALAPGAFDIGSGCSGFVYGLGVASAAVQTGQARHVLVVASERFSGWLDMNDRKTSVILGDGAAAAVVGPADHVGIGPVVWGSSGDLHDAVTIDEHTRYFRQEGQTVYRWVTTQMAPVATAAIERAGLLPEDIAVFVPHQANLRIIDTLATRIGLPNAVVARDIVTSGNTSGTTIPLAMSRMKEAGEIPSGAPALLLGFGSGLAYAAQVVLAP